MNDLVIQQEAPLSVAEIKAQVNTIQRVLRSVMKEGVHYGVIPGTQKRTLYKPGAEKIMVTFRLCGEPLIEDLSGPDEHRFRVVIRLTATDGRPVGYGVVFRSVMLRPH